MPPLVACPSCEQHAKISEDRCPHCGAPLRDGKGRLLRTATAAVLGLASATASCKTAEPVSEYGPAPTAKDPSAVGSASADPSARPTPPNEPVAEYGPAPSIDNDGPDPNTEPVDEYGPPPTME